jgi:hypothetical protein
MALCTLLITFFLLDGIPPNAPINGWWLLGKWWIVIIMPGLVYLAFGFFGGAAIYIEKEEKVWKKIDKILWELWDPIGVNAYQGTRDEYRDYVDGVYHLLKDGAGKTSLAEYLFDIEVNAMALNGDREKIMAHCKHVPEALSKIEIN